ncbi:MAG: hypothetical protein ISP86_03920 [Shewanellaceae bacterium]|nr:hypothetical protein [Shewanellaceae bacterium]
MLQFDPLSLKRLLPIPWLVALLASFILGFFANDSTQAPETLQTHIASDCDPAVERADYTKAMALLKDLNRQLIKEYETKQAYNRLNDTHTSLIKDKNFIQEKNIQLQQQVANLSAVLAGYTVKNQEFSLVAKRSLAVKNNHVFSLLEVTSDRVQVNFDDIGYSLKAGEQIKFQEGKEQCTLKLTDIASFTEKATFTMVCS